MGYVLDKKYKLEEPGKPILTEKEKVLEYLKCRISFSYFVENYCYVNAGVSLHVGTSDAWKSTYRYRELMKFLQYSEFNEILGSRQIFKTTSLYYYSAWVVNFHPDQTVFFVTLDATRAIEFIRNTKFVLSNLPSWMTVQNKNKSDKALSIDLVNGSRVLTDTVSGSKSMTSIGRGLSPQNILLDEAAFYKDLSTLWTSILPAYNKAADTAKKEGNPYGIIITTTPNGKHNHYYEMFYSRGTHLNHIKDMLGKPEKELTKSDILNIPSEILYENQKNGFIIHELHWSLLYDQAWYEKQKAILQYDKRKIGQELDLVFLGASNSILDDEILAEMKIQEPIDYILLSGGYKIELYKELQNRKIVIGVDTATSTLSTADYSAIELTDGITGEELGSFRVRIGILQDYATLIKSLILYLTEELGIPNVDIYLAIENNSIGKAIIEYLVYDEYNDYEQYIIKTKVNKTEEQFGIYTGAKQRNDMQLLFLNIANRSPEMFHSKNLIGDINTLEQLHSGRIEAKKPAHDDNWMAYNLSLYGRKLLIENGMLIVEGEITKNAINPTQKMNYLDLTMHSIPDRIEQEEIVDTSETEIIYEDDSPTNLENLIIF